MKNFFPPFRILDAASPWQRNFQTPASIIREKIVELHHDIMAFLIAILIFVSWRLARTIYLFNVKNLDTLRIGFAHHTKLEIVWTIIPTLILRSFVLPSFALLYTRDKLVEPTLTVKVIGHQWYWSYEATNRTTGVEVAFDSYRLSEEDLNGGLRLLEVDSRLFLPTKTNIRILTASVDVIHSWAVPSLGLKTDAIPGRLNQVSLWIERPGTYYGQCSELCGANHSFRPIVVQALESSSEETFSVSTRITAALVLRSSGGPDPELESDPHPSIANHARVPERRISTATVEIISSAAGTVATIAATAAAYPGPHQIPCAAAAASAFVVSVTTNAVASGRAVQDRVTAVSNAAHEAHRAKEPEGD